MFFRVFHRIEKSKIYMDSFISSLFYPQLYKLGTWSVHHVRRYPIRHTVWVGVHISNRLLLLYQLMNFNETFWDILLTQCWGAPTTYIFGCWKFLIAWNRLWLEAGDINWLTIFLVIHWFWNADPCAQCLMSNYIFWHT